MANFQLTQTGNQIQADLNRVEGELAKITYDSTYSELKIGATDNEMLVADNGDVTVNRDLHVENELLLDSLDNIKDTDGNTLLSFTYDSSTGTLAIVKR